MHACMCSFFSCYVMLLEGCREKQLSCIIGLWVVLGVSGVISVVPYYFHDRFGNLQKIKWTDCKI